MERPGASGRSRSRPRSFASTCPYLRDGKLVEGLQAGDFELRDVLLKALEEFRSRVRVRARSGYVEEEDRR